MKYVDEYRDPEAVARLVAAIRDVAVPARSLMEVCGGQTHSILKFGLDRLLAGAVRFVHGPGCPVCVTPLEQIDRAVAVAARPGVIFCSYGDMLRVPGTEEDLLRVKAKGGDVRIVSSPLDALALARRNPSREVVFFAVGFETTAPADAMAVHRAAREGIENFSVLLAHVLVPPALEALLAEDTSLVDGFLAPGHVCTITGTREYELLAQKHRVPIAVTGFEPLDILRGVHAAVAMLSRRENGVVNAYPRAVRTEGNLPARRMLEEVFVVADQAWRGLGVIPKSGYALAPAYARYDAVAKFSLEGITAQEPADCRAGLVLQGRLSPPDCPEFGARCTPEHPLGATMVSTEGACAAYFHYGRLPALASATAAGR